MIASMLAVAWQPEIRGILVVLIMVVVLIGGTYLIIGTNLGARLGFLVAMAGFFGWMMSMALIWWVYGIGLKGNEPSWKPAEPIAIVRDPANLHSAEVIETSVKTEGMSSTDAAKAAAEQMIAEGWVKLDEADPRRGQAAASSDDLLQNKAEEFKAGEYLTIAVYDRGGERWPKINETLDFLAFKHKPRYAVVEVAPVIQQRTEPGRAPARPVVDDAQSHRYVVMLRDLGNKRQPAMFITLGSGIIFLLLCWVLHRREAYVMSNRTSVTPVKA